jgi:hypothetical protein
MGSPDLVAILDHCIAEFEKYLEEQISDLVAAHAGSSLYTAEDALEELWSIRGWLDDLKVLRKKVVAGESSTSGEARMAKRKVKERKNV